MKSVVCAYGAVGHACLEALLDAGAKVGLVVTHEDAPGENIWFPSVAHLAERHGIEVVRPVEVNGVESQAAVAAAEPDYLFSFYFRQMMAPALLALPSGGALNLHGSFLPRYRGRAPVNWVLVHGETDTGVTLHYMDEKPDHGDIVAQRRIAIGRDDTALVLTQKIAAAGADVVRETYPLLVAGRAPRRPQDHAAATYFGGRRPEDGRLDWARPADELRNLVRAVTDPWPGAFSEFRGRRLFVWRAETRSSERQCAPGVVFVDAGGRPLVTTSAGMLELQDVTWGDGSRQSGHAWVRAAGIADGESFDPAPGAERGGSR